MQKVFVVILNWNRKKDTIECLKSVQEFKIKSYELFVVVVDNNSSDGSIKAIKNLKLKANNQSLKVKIIENKENLGYVGGNNVGIKYSLDHGADWVMVLNNDTRVGTDLVVNLLEGGKKYPKAGIISPKIFFEKGFEFHKKRYKKDELGKVIWYAGGEFDWKNVLGSNHGVDEVDNGQFEVSREIDFATGACMFLRASSIEDVGMFDEKYFMYLEDVDLSMRMLRSGYKIIFFPKAKLWHKVGGSSAIGGKLNDYFLSRNRLLFGSRYANLRAKLALARESVGLYFGGREWQKRGVWDYYLQRFGKGSWE